jgi:hypothetical protein
MANFSRSTIHSRAGDFQALSMKRIRDRGEPQTVRADGRKMFVAGTGLGFLLTAVCCSANGSGSGDPCRKDLNGLIGGSHRIDLTVDDMAFSVGGPDSGSMQSNITVENSATITLTMVNVGTKSHDLVVQCRSTPNNSGCPMQSCFPPSATIPPLPPGGSATTTFVTPFNEGPYLFTSDVDGDTKTSPDGSVTGLVGEFVLL